MLYIIKENWGLVNGFSSLEVISNFKEDSFGRVLRLEVWLSGLRENRRRGIGDSDFLWGSFVVKGVKKGIIVRRGGDWKVVYEDGDLMLELCEEI